MIKTKVLNILFALILSSAVAGIGSHSTAHADDSFRTFNGGQSALPHTPMSAEDAALLGALIGTVAGAIIENKFNTGGGGGYYQEPLPPLPPLPPSASYNFTPKPLTGSYLDRMVQQSRNSLNQAAAQYPGISCQWFLQQASGNVSILPDRCR